MRIFETYVERRESCDAIRYCAAEEAHWIATELFHTYDYCVTEGGLVLTLPYTGGTGEREKLKINQGDYIIRNGFGYKVVDRSSFQRKFEKK